MMREVTSSNFGLAIAYLIPGFTALWGISYYSETLAAWLRSPPGDAPVVGGFLYVTITSLAVGMVVNAFRWLTLDHLHHVTGIPYPDWDFSRLQDDLGAYALLVDFYYRYHEFFGNMLIAGSFSYGVWRFYHPGWENLPSDVLFLGLAALCWAGSRDTLRKYYLRSQTLLRRASAPTSESKQKPVASATGS